MRATSRKVGSGSIQCSACTARTTSAPPAGSPGVVGPASYVGGVRRGLPSPGRTHVVARFDAHGYVGPRDGPPGRQPGAAPQIDDEPRTSPAVVDHQLSQFPGRHGAHAVIEASETPEATGARPEGIAFHEPIFARREVAPECRLPVGSGGRRREKTELVALRVDHDGYLSSWKLLARAGVRSSECDDALHSGLELADEDVDVEAELADLPFWDRLKVHERSVRRQRLQSQPSRAVESCFRDRGGKKLCPEPRQTPRLVAVDRDSPPEGRFTGHEGHSRRVAYGDGCPRPPVIRVIHLSG